MQFTSSSVALLRAFLAMLDVRLTQVTSGGPPLEAREVQAMLSDVRELREELDGSLTE